MSKFSIYIVLPDYLHQWLKFKFWDESSKHVVFPRGSAPRAIIKSLIRKTPPGYVEIRRPGSLAVQVPSIKGLNPASFNYLSESGRKALVSACKSMFRAMMFTELHENFCHDIQIADLVYDFMDSHGIERTGKNWETIRQMYANA